MINLYKLDVYLIPNVSAFELKYGRIPSSVRKERLLPKDDFLLLAKRYPTAYHDYITTHRDRELLFVEGVGNISVITSTIKHTLPEDVPLLVPAEIIGALRGINNPIYTIANYGTPCIIYTGDLKARCYTELYRHQIAKQ